ncbi:MAG: gluconate 2-dehydrogenase subunit 3 family protein [Acidisphaera sp.]|nr:gluconate 2-dehydrogenase subunit 3 family protein [Acidisphaera sp.]
MTISTRRQLLASAAIIVFSRAAFGHTILGKLPWRPNEVYPPEPLGSPGWHFFTPGEAATVDAMVDRFIPADELGPGGKQAGCTVFIDRQLSGPYGTYEWLYMKGPFPADPLPSQGLQSPLTPRQQYRLGLAALNAYCRGKYDNRAFAQLDADAQDKLLDGMEKGEVQLPEFSARMLFGTVLANTMEGFFADPIYGGNRDMAGWKLIGFPGTRYDYRDVMQNPNKPYSLPPVGLKGRVSADRSPT